jgi:hypothetical protein
MPTDPAMHSPPAAPKMTYPQSCIIVQDLLQHSDYFRGLMAARGVPDVLPNVIIDHTSVHPMHYDGLARIFREIANNLEEQWFKLTENTNGEQPAT